MSQWRGAKNKATCFVKNYGWMGVITVNTIQIECGSWFEREDGLIQVINKKNRTVILNENYSIIWKAMDNEIEQDELIEKLKNKFNEESINKYLQKLKAFELISIYSSTDYFDRMFN